MSRRVLQVAGYGLALSQKAYRQAVDHHLAHWRQYKGQTILRPRAVPTTPGWYENETGYIRTENNRVLLFDRKLIVAPLLAPHSLIGSFPVGCPIQFCQRFGLDPYSFRPDGQDLTAGYGFLFTEIPRRE